MIAPRKAVLSGTTAVRISYAPSGIYSLRLMDPMLLLELSCYGN
jgi:hypothetical protein